MEYIKGTPYFTKAEKKIKQFPYLNKSIKCDLLIVGGGIDGLIGNYYLSKKYDTVLVEKSRLAMACTSCATALCEYQLDKYAFEIFDEMSEDTVARVYNMGLQGIQKMEKFINEYGNECHFEQVPTLIYSNTLKGASELEKEFLFRQKYNFPCKLLDSKTNFFPFEIKAGIYAENGGCCFNPYLFSKQLAENASNVKNIYENTDIDAIEKKESGFEVTTNFGDIITCNKIVIATGFNWEIIKKDDICERFTTYTIVTRPLENLEFYKNTMMEDDGDPYHYFRMMPDKRIIFGGEDKKWKETISASDAQKAYEKLEKDLKKMLPDYADKIQVEYKFCGSFGSTDNNLGVIGESETKGLYYFFSCGANGIINAFYGADLLDDLFNNKPNELQQVFSYER